MLREAKQKNDFEGLLETGAALGPWHLQVEIAPGFSTRDLYEASRDNFSETQFYDPGPSFKTLLERIYPKGLEGRTVLDCACNNGSHLFAAKEMGAGRCLGYDVHELWVEQARFLAKHRRGPSGDMRFDVSDIYDLPKRDIGQFDITIFSGILYHLPDPIAGLRIAADQTSELLYVSGATRSGFPDGALIAGDEPVGPPLSGIHGLQWFPTGPKAIHKMMAWMGFGESRTVNWWNPDNSPSDLDCVTIIAARDDSALSAFDTAPTSLAAQLLQLVTAMIPPKTTVLVAGAGDELVISDRKIWCFPQDETGAHDERMQHDDRGLIRQLEALRAAGAKYLLVPRSQSEWFDGSALHDYVALRYDVFVRDEAGVIHDMTQ
jgi:tRNA (mo5U34)-methyltransferase